MADEFPGLRILPQMTGDELVVIGSPTLPDYGARSNVLGGAPIVVNSQSVNYTTVLADTGALLLHPSTDAVTRTFTIDSNANVPYPVGTCISFINEASTLLIACSDTMTLGGSRSTGTRTLTACGVATAIKTHSTAWVISGANLT